MAILTGTSSNDILIADASDDVLDGGAGDDILVGGGGQDQLIGGTGIDTASYVGAVFGVFASLSDPSVNTGDAFGDTYSGIENLTGSATDDVLIGDAGNNVLDGGAGDDDLIGGAGADTLIGGTGTNTASYETAISGVVASLADLSINTGDAAGDTYSNITELDGSDFDDTLIGDAGDNVLDGGDGNDILTGGAGADTLLGGAGNNTASYSTATAKVTVNLSNIYDNTGDALGDGYSNIENLAGSSFDDTLTGDSADNVLDGAAGNDTLDGGTGSDILIGGAGADHMTGGTGSDTASYVTATVSVTASLATPADNTGDAAGDTYNSIENLAGSNFDDTLFGDAGDNTLDGGAGNDVLIGGAGDDSLVGGLGSDTASYASSAIAIVASLATPSVNTGDAAGDSYDSIENLEGSSFDDILTGDAGDNVLTGDAGADQLDGGAGSDSAGYTTSTAGVTASLANRSDNTGDAAGDTYVSIENLIGSSFNDILTGDAGDNVLTGGAGADQLIGGAGSDTAGYATAVAGVIASLSDTSVNTGDAAGDTYDSIENLIGSAFNDTLTGDAGDNVLNGGAGDDILNGGHGIDTLTGGAGKDTFVVQAGNEHAIITDFVPGQDVVELHGGPFTDASALLAAAVQSGADVVITVDATTTIVLQNVNLGKLHAGDFKVISDNQPPVAVADHLTTKEDAPLVLSAAALTANDTDANGDALTVTSVGNAAHGTVSLVNGNVTFIADANFSGIAQFDYTVSDGKGGSSTATATVDVAPVADVPNLITQPAAGNENTAVPLDVSAALTDTDGSEILALTVSSIPVGATLTDGVHTFTASQGSTSIDITVWNLPNLTLTPPLNFSGDLQLSVTATSTDTAVLTNGTASDTVSVTQTIDIKIAEVDQPPVAVADHLTTKEDAPLVLSAAALTANDTDANGNALTVTSVGNAAHGTVSLVNGNVTFIADANFSGIAQFDYTVSDGKGGSSTATATVDAAPVADVPNLQVVGAAQSKPGAGAVKVGEEFLVNTVLAGTQQNSTITKLANGGFVVAWEDGRGPKQGGDPFGISAQIFDATGSKVDEEFQVNATASFFQAEPSVSPLANGGFVVTWLDFSGEGDDPSDGGDTSEGAVKAQIFDANGRKFGSEFLVNTVTAFFQGEPATATLANGGFVVTWDDLSGENSGSSDSDGAIKAQIFDATGGKIGGEILVNSPTAFSQDDPAVAALANGGFVVTWDGLDPNGNIIEIKAQIFNGAGGKIGDEFVINSGGAEPIVTALATGGFVVTWDSFGEGPTPDTQAVKAQIFDASGGKVGAELLVSTPKQEAHTIFPSTILLANGGFVITWSEFENQSVDAPTSPLYAQVFDASGGKVGTTLLINTKGDDPAITALADNEFVVTWSDDDSVKAQVFTLSDANVDTSLPLNVSVALVDIDGSETLALSVSTIPMGATLTDGIHTFTATSGATSVDITGWALPKLTVTPPLHFVGDFQLTVVATLTDTAILSTGLATDSKTVTQTIDVNILPSSGSALTNSAIHAFARGDGQEQIVNGVAANNGPGGELDFAAGIGTDQLWFQRAGNDLSISVIGSKDKVTIAGWYDTGAAQLQEIKTSDGWKMDTQLSQLVQAMASYSAAHAGFDPGAATQAPNDPGLQSAIASSWHH